MSLGAFIGAVHRLAARMDDHFELLAGALSSTPEKSRRSGEALNLPRIYDAKAVDELVYVSQGDAEDMARRLAREEGLFAGISAAGACWVALQVARTVSHATIVFIVCDRGDRYLSTGVFPA